MVNHSVGGAFVNGEAHAKIPNFVSRDLCINMNNHQNAIFHQITNFLKTPLALLGVDLKNFQFNKICHFANHPYLCKGLYISFFTVKYISRRGGDNGSSNCCKNDSQ